jgi:hypothetical protein
VEKLHNEKLNDLYSSLNNFLVKKSRRTSWAGLVARMWERRGIYCILVRSSDGKNSFLKIRRRWVDNIKMELQEYRSGCLDWIDLAQNRDSS